VLYIDEEFSWGVITISEKYVIISSLGSREAIVERPVGLVIGGCRRAIGLSKR
jgi:hypothetical protein